MFNEGMGRGGSSTGNLPGMIRVQWGDGGRGASLGADQVGYVSNGGMGGKSSTGNLPGMTRVQWRNWRGGRGGGELHWEPTRHDTCPVGELGGGWGVGSTGYKYVD